MSRQKKNPLPLPPFDLTRYEGHETWTHKQWAWEFLRRNVDFKAACDALTEEVAQETKITAARKFGLAKFKHYSEPFSSSDGTIAAPLFLSKAVFSIKPVKQDDGSWKQQILVRPSQFAIRFDLGPALESDTVLEAQLASAEAILKRRLDKLRKAKKVEAKPVKGRRGDQLLLQLKILDLLELDATHDERAELLWGVDERGRNGKNLLDQAKGARALSETGYLLVAAKGDSLPSWKSPPPSSLGANDVA